TRRMFSCEVFVFCLSVCHTNLYGTLAYCTCNIHRNYLKGILPVTKLWPQSAARHVRTKRNDDKPSK
ncbi:Hypothetical predicted protein, partial [Paramuricea clavata]